ncbi:MAG TPA: hypothetical protein VNE61_11790 [Ktedonobacteraceae bacterium]|nr:hypothetical protein [Ktedonobacteraceae bacterium]
MNSYLPLNTGQTRIGPYVAQFVGSDLLIAQASAPEQPLVRLEETAALELTEWLGLSRPRLFAMVMRDGLEGFKAQVRAEYHLPEPEEPEEHVIYVSPSSCDETLIALSRAADVALVCNLCHQRLCTDCYNCHNRRCRHYCDQSVGHVSSPSGQSV